MNKTTKALLIPVAAFAVTVTGASAFNSQVLEDAGLNDDQISAFEQAHELRKEGDREAAREVIEDAGIDQDTLVSVRKAMHAHKKEMRSAVDAAIEAGDYDAFIDAIEGSPIADIVTSEDDFERFAEAHELRAEGDREAAREIMEDLGFEGKKHGRGMHKDGEGAGRGGHFGKYRGGNQE